MQIDNNNSIQGFVQNTKDRPKTNSTTTTAAGQQHSVQQNTLPDTVTLTQAAAQLHTIEQQIKSTPVADTHRITQVKDAIEAGNYSPDPGQIASKMLDFESVLNSSRHFA